MFLLKKSIKSDEAISKEFSCRIKEINDVRKSGWLNHIGSDFDFTGRIFRSFINNESISTINFDLLSIPKNKSNGIIIYSCDFKISLPNLIFGMVNWFKNDFELVQKKITPNESVKIDVHSCAYSIGNSFITSFSNNVRTFNKNSITVEILGFPFDFFIPIVADLSRTFKQDFVLVKDWTSNKFSMIELK